MQHKTIPLADTKAFSPFFLDYISQKENLRPFYHRFPLPEKFAEQIAEKGASFPKQNRDTIVAALRRQYAHLTPSAPVRDNISALADGKTFTVTTGHQLNIFTGPLYFIYKIVTVINACKRLKDAYPNFHFVPIYWMASEDHDYEEIKYFRLYGKKYVWTTSQSGAVGRFNTKGLDKLSKEIPGDVSVFEDAYRKNKTLAEAVRHYVDVLFGKDGLVVVDGDDRELKSLFRPVIREDIFKNSTVALVNETSALLKKLGYKTQVYCRDVNFFYLDKDVRERIDKEQNHYRVMETQLSFSEEELNKLIDSEPEKFSPNVILRPLYQEWILPNLAYVGGPAENIYWLQLKKVFDHYAVPFPMLMPRNFAVVLDHTVQRKLIKTGIDVSEVFEDKHVLFNRWTLAHSDKELTIDAERTVIREIYDQLQKKAEAIDKTLGPFTAAEGTRVMNSLERIERKLLRAEKRRHTEKLGQIEAVKDALFPNGSLQERVDNFLNFYQQDKDFINKLLQHFDPFNYEFNILTYQDA